MAIALQETHKHQEALDYVHSHLGTPETVMGEVFQPKSATGQSSSLQNDFDPHQRVCEMMIF